MGIERLAQYTKRARDSYSGLGKLSTPILAKIEGVTVLCYKGDTCLYLLFPPEHPLAQIGGAVFVHPYKHTNAGFGLLFCFIPITDDGCIGGHSVGMLPAEVHQLIPRAVIRFCWKQVQRVCNDHKS